MHGTSSLAKLIKQILDLLGKILVLSPDGVKMLKHLLVGGLDAEVLRAVVAAFSLAGGDLSLEVLSLESPFIDNLVEVPASLLDDGGVGQVPLTLSSQVIKLSLSSGLPKLYISKGLGELTLNLHFGLIF